MLKKDSLLVFHKKNAIYFAIAALKTYEVIHLVESYVES